MKTTRTLEEWTALIDQIVGHYQKLDATCKAVRKVGAMDIDGPLHEAIWTAFEGMLAMVDVEGWIQWYLYENECGVKQLTVHDGGQKRVMIHSADVAGMILLALEEEGGL